MLTNASSTAPSYLEHQHAEIDALFDDARKDFHQNSPCDKTLCRNNAHCIGDLSTTLGKLITLMTDHFTDEQRHMKPYSSAEHYEDHCEEHGKITQLILNAVVHFNTSHCCIEVLSLLENIQALVKRHRETFDSQIDFLLRPGRADPAYDGEHRVIENDMKVTAKKNSREVSLPQRAETIALNTAVRKILPG